MSSEYMGPGPTPNPESQKNQPFQAQSQQHEEPVYREHVSGPLIMQPTNGPQFQAPYSPNSMPNSMPAMQGPGQQQGGQNYQPSYPNQAGTPPQYQQYQQYPAYNGYSSQQPQQPQQPALHGQYSYPQQQVPYGQYGYPQNQYAPYGYPPYQGYYPYPYAWQPPQPKRDGYLMGIALTSFIGSILVFLGGLACCLVLFAFTVLPSSANLGARQELSGIVLFTALAIAGVLGGGFGLYHSIRSLFLKKPSADFKLPWFWTFLILYLVLLVAGALLRANGQSIANIPFTIVLIALAGLLPALTILALAVRRLHFPIGSQHWPTTWRRFTLALVSGATQAIVFASIFELILSAIAIKSLGVTGFSLNNPDQPIPSDPRAIGFLLILVSVIAPFVEEAVKPLAVVIMIGRVRNASEAFVLGLASGIGFDLIETSGYISQGYRDWLDVAIQRSSAGLLHGLGAAMVTLGWYYLTHPKESKQPFLLAVGCWGYAVLQHAIWNGSFVLQLLPAPIGPYLTNGVINIGIISFPAFILVYIVETALMLTFLVFVTGRLRRKPPVETPTGQAQNAPTPSFQGARV